MNVMKNMTIILIIGILVASCSSTVAVKQKVVITGKYSWENWKVASEWKNFDAEQFVADEFLVSEISELSKVNNIKYLLFAGSWCGDSESEVPKIMKLIDKATLNDKIEIWGLDRDKKEPNNTQLPYSILKVPTLIILKNSQEIGRIIEFPKSSWDIDLYEILIKS